MHWRSSCVSRGSELFSIRYMDPNTKIFNHNYTIAACNPLYPNVVKLKDGSFQQYGETLKKFNRRIYQWSLNSNLNVIDENLYRNLFSTSDVKQSQIAQIIRRNSKGIISREAFQDPYGKYSHEIYIHWNDQFQQQFFLTNEIIAFRNLRTEAKWKIEKWGRLLRLTRQCPRLLTKGINLWLKAEDIAVSVLTVYLIFQFVKKFP